MTVIHSFAEVEVSMNLKRRLPAAALLLGCVLAASPSKANPLIITVNGTSGPWDFSETLNSGLAFGDPDAKDFTLTVRPIADYGLAPGQAAGLFVVDGLTNAFGGAPEVPNAGYFLPPSPLKDDTLGSSGFNLPSLHIPQFWGTALNAQDNRVIVDESGVFLMGLMYAFLDANFNVILAGALGAVTSLDTNNDGISDGVGYTIGIGIIPLPMNAFYISLGFNDDIFADNTGAIDVCFGPIATVGAGDCRLPTETSEPATLALLGAGLLGLAAVRRRKA